MKREDSNTPEKITPAQFAELDRRFNDFVGYKVNGEKLEKTEESFLHGNFEIGDQLYNIFEITGRFSPEIKKIMSDCGARGTLMSGSGSSVFGIFANDADAQSAKDIIIEKGYRAFLCRPKNIL